MKELYPLQLKNENFKDYGVVLNEAQEPKSDNADFNYLGKISKLELGPISSSGMLWGYKREIVKSMERHLNTMEVMVALEGDSVICVGKPGDNSKQIEGVKAFYIRQGDAFALNKGTWHYVPFAVNNRGCKFLILFTLDTETNDLELKELPEPIKININLKA